MAETSAESDWDFYFCNVNEALSSVMVDLAANRRAPMSHKPCLLWVWVKMQSPREDGLSSNDEAAKLYEIEDRLTRSLGEVDAEFVGRITGDSRREFYFYAPTADIDAALSSVQKAFPEYTVEGGTRHDAAWSQYRELLYPSVKDMQRIQDRRVVNNLAKRGDVHSIPRPVDHAVYFRSESDRKAFSMAAALAGFSAIHEGDFDTDRNRQRYFLNVVRTDPVELDHINAVVAQLRELARMHNGDYDGWGCEVETEKADGR